MLIEGNETIFESVDTVWRALNDPEILRASIPGCESLTMVGATGFEATVVLKIGPIKARFNGVAELRDLNPPYSYTLAGEGKGGVAGFVKGQAAVALSRQDENTTILSYKAKADVGGKLAQLGSRLIETTAKKVVAEFFGAFGKRVGDVSG